MVASAALVSACGAFSEDSGSESETQEQNSVVKPDGSDFPARLKVVAPFGAAETTKVKVDNLTGVLGQELSPVAVGIRAVTLDSSLTTTANVSFAQNQLTTVYAGLVSLDAQNAPITFGLNQKDVVYGTYRRLGRREGSTVKDLNAVSSHLGATVSAAMLPGSYFLKFGQWDGVSFDVGEGESKTIPLYEGRRVAKVTVPVREFPTPTCAKRAERDTLPTYKFTFKNAFGNTFGSDDMKLADGAEVELGTHPLGSGDDDKGYELTISGLNEFGRTLPLGVRGNGPLAFPIARLDVDDVAVTQSDGSIKMVRGTYRAYHITTDAQGHEEVGQMNVVCSSGAPTHSGIDLFPGRYRVEVRYSVSEGNKTAVYDVDVR